jgi:hypothetical protein
LSGLSGLATVCGKPVQRFRASLNGGALHVTQHAADTAHLGAAGHEDAPDRPSTSYFESARVALVQSDSS